MPFHKSTSSRPLLQQTSQFRNNISKRTTSSLLTTSTFTRSFHQPSLQFSSRHLHVRPDSHLSFRPNLRTTPPHRKMHILSIPMWTGTGNNYAYLVSDPLSRQAVIIDPANPPEVLPVLKDKIGSHDGGTGSGGGGNNSGGGKLHLKAIINTHHHGDHAGGNVEVRKHYQGLEIIGGKDCDAVSRTPGHGETFRIGGGGSGDEGGGIEVTALHTPCHTQDSICWYMRDLSPSSSSTTSSSSRDGSEAKRAIFTGDTLFIGGCGRFFEGTAQEMHTALNTTLSNTTAVPNDTRVYPGHEYTKSNVKFLEKVLPHDEAVKRLKTITEEHRQTQGKTTMGEEKGWNVFMRVVGDREVQRAVLGKDGGGEEGQVVDPVVIMGKLREMKNNM